MRAYTPLTLLVMTIAMGACSSATPPTAPNAMIVDAGNPPPPGSGVLGAFAGVGHQQDIAVLPLLRRTLREQEETSS